MSEPNTPATAAPPAARTVSRADAETAVRRAANWFFWIAGLSLVNSYAAASHMNFRMLLGLGITQLVDVLFPGGQTLQVVLLALVLGFFCLVGLMARRPSLPWYLTGMVVYALDALLCLWASDWQAVAFHAFVLYVLWRGLTVLRALAAHPLPDATAPPG
jgi:hypothetical protein